MTATDEGTKAVTDLVTVTIDGIEVSVPAGTLVIRAAEQIGVEIPRFCDHPLLEPVGACRQCLVDVPDAGNGKGFPKPQASCTLPVAPGMVVETQVSSAVAAKAQRGNLEFLLANHPLDCPVCDKGGECPLQNQAMSHGDADSRFTETKRTFAKPVPVSEQVLLDRERCVLCQRCTRFSEEIAGDPFIELLERGAKQQIGTADGTPFHSYFSGNTIQICPVGALTSADYRFRARPFDLVSTPSIAEHDACGAAIRVDHRRGKVMRRLAGDDPEVNEEWISDKDRFAFAYARKDRLSTPLVRDPETGELVPSSWPGALAIAARGLAGKSVGILPGGRLPVEDAKAYAALAAALGGDIDFRSRPHADEEAQFLASTVKGSGLGVTHADLESANHVVLAGLEPEDEAATIFLRLLKGTRKGLKVTTVGSHLSRGSQKLGAELVQCVPGAEAAAIAALKLADDDILLVGERLALAPGALSAAAASNARVAWVPRRAGDRGALEAGCLGTGRNLEGILEAATIGELDALIVGGVEVADLPDPEVARDALEKAFVVSLEVRRSEVTEDADVVLPVSAMAERSGSFVNWEGRVRSFDTVLHVPGALADREVLAKIAAEMRLTLDEPAEGEKPAPPTVGAQPATAPQGQVLVSTWRQLIDSGRGQDATEEYKATARPAVLRANAKTLGGFADAHLAMLSTELGHVVLPVEVDDLPDGVVWLPGNSRININEIGLHHGAAATLAPAPHGGRDE